ncbi:hypothetical protein CYLTODRAFT_425338 [Cylindrobasidium torrendii FP15055 ss-10]|uniref:Uncharacterized protein n=1 Tax=Cylindrobasidium torrendii FP15055 ss-10 TaxID=1314674 RepID=A0A0D7B271_9AGAR|nr:hypothetical protein CYLTODRAFT_425338 [Cylindrobasidium torrendii FP15055 ss-10]
MTRSRKKSNGVGKDEPCRAYMYGECRSPYCKRPHIGQPRQSHPNGNSRRMPSPTPTRTTPTGPRRNRPRTPPLPSEQAEPRLAQRMRIPPSPSVPDTPMAAEIRPAYNMQLLQAERANGSPTTLREPSETRRERSLPSETRPPPSETREPPPHTVKHEKVERRWSLHDQLAHEFEQFDALKREHASVQAENAELQRECALLRAEKAGWTQDAEERYETEKEAWAKDKEELERRVMEMEKALAQSQARVKTSADACVYQENRANHYKQRAIQEFDLRKAAEKRAHAVDDDLESILERVKKRRCVQPGN